MSDEYIKREDAERMFMEYLCAEYHIYALNDDIETDRRIKTAIKISKEMFSHLKSADVAPVVRCKECMYSETDEMGSYYCAHGIIGGYGVAYDANTFCSYGEREDDEL